MYSADGKGTRGLAEAMYARIGSCLLCRHFGWQGLAEPGYCTGRDDLRYVYGNFYELADHGGARCSLFVEG